MTKEFINDQWLMHEATGQDHCAPLLVTYQNKKLKQAQIHFTVSFAPDQNQAYENCIIMFNQLFSVYKNTGIDGRLYATFTKTETVNIDELVEPIQDFTGWYLPCGHYNRISEFHRMNNVLSMGALSQKREFEVSVEFEATSQLLIDYLQRTWLKPEIFTAINGITYLKINKKFELWTK